MALNPEREREREGERGRERERERERERDLAGEKRDKHIWAPGVSIGHWGREEGSRRRFGHGLT